jgi:hypothetical protein
MSPGAEGFCLNGQHGAPIQQAEEGHHAARPRCRHPRKISRAAARLARDQIRNGIGLACLDHANRCVDAPQTREWHSKQSLRRKVTRAPQVHESSCPSAPQTPQANPPTQAPALIHAAAFTTPDDIFAHGLNEKLPASEVAAGLEFWHRVLTRLAK